MKRSIRTVLASIIVVYSLFPIYWVAVVAFSPESAAFLGWGGLWPAKLSLENFANLFAYMPFAKYFAHTCVVAFGSTALATILAVPAAYAFARWKFRARRPLLLSVLMLYMVPPIVLVVPLMVLYNRLGIFNTLYGLIVANMSICLPFAMWILIGFFSSLPRDLEEAALIDGCTLMGMLWRVVLPLSVPGIVAVSLFVFITSWNDFLYAFTLTSGDSAKTLQAAMRTFARGEGGVFWGTIMAAVSVSAAPIMALFLVFQKHLIAGLTEGAVKG